MANAGRTSSISRIEANGFASIAGGGLSNPRYLAFTDDNGVPLKLVNQVPEPSTLAMLALGLSALIARRRSEAHA